VEQKFNQTVDIFKVDDEKHIVYGKALVPDRVDSQGDIVSKQDIETAAHNFLINIQKAYAELVSSGANTTNASQIGLMHKVFKGVGGFGYVVESYIDPSGSWILGTMVTDPTIWQMIKDGQITGYSIGGNGTRIPTS
jgi:DNA adenine methylase